MKRLLILLIPILALSLIGVQSCYSEEIIYGVDEESSQDMVMLHGTIVSVKDRYISLDDVNPLCRGNRTFFIRYKAPQVNLTSGKQVWFWLIGSCGDKDDVIDIIVKPEGTNS